MSASRTYTNYRCACCGGRLPKDRYLYSRFTGLRHHWPGECRGERRRKRQGGTTTTTNTRGDAA